MTFKIIYSVNSTIDSVFFLTFAFKFYNIMISPMKSIIVIPVYKTIITSEEKQSLKQCMKILGTHRICLVCPKSLNTTIYHETAGVKLPCKRFSDVFFNSIDGYNRLMTSHTFYQRFCEYEYMLIYQLDAWVFRDELDAWCQKGYEYIGAPWFEKHLSHEEGYKLWCTGNGGLSLRKVSAFIRVTNPRLKIKSCKEIFRDEYHSIRDLGHCILRCMSPLIGNNTMRHYMKQVRQHMWEDGFFSYGLESTRHRLNIPTPEEAAWFSFEVSPKYLFNEVTHGKLPFGCHAWKKYQYEEFWKQYIP